ncbi:YdeI/OmpD-associated family protein [Emticicia sediminis]
MQQKEEIETFYPSTTADWRTWLQENHLSKQSVWLIYYKKKSKIPSISWSEAVDEALCFGWIDSTARPIDDEKYMQFFTRRKATSVWSKINKDKVEKLIAAGKMSQAGFESIEKAKQNSSWTILDSVEELTISEDLEAAFQANEGSKDFFMGLSKSVRKAILQWLVLAKQQSTRQKRINEIAELAAQKLKPKQFR